ncbi:glycosyltransferase, partial [Omnitrophica bacterium]|nr:glycosyltransferase [Candidatus Omnitrophota bacterium]
MEVTLYQRNSSDTYSIEGITKNIVDHLSGDVRGRIFIPSKSTTNTLSRLRGAVEAIFEQGDVNHITGDAHFLSYFLKKSRTILTIHDIERLMSKDFGFIKRVLYKLFWVTIPSFRCEYITTISEESKKNIERYGGIPKERIRLIYDGVDEKFRPLGLSLQEKNKLLLNEQNKKTVLHVSDARKIKNTLRLIEAMKDLNIKLIKVGALRSEEAALLDQYKIEF